MVFVCIHVIVHVIYHFVRNLHFWDIEVLE
jgi:hypothetical protein